MFSVIIFVAFSLLPAFPISRASNAPENCRVTLQNGPVVGSILETVNPLKNVCAYTSIPYARPPLGALRFQPPRPAPPWNATLQATRLQNWCPQGEDPPSEDIQISEDCLYLNVYQPQNSGNNASAEGPLPVMVWFHGGGFTGGSSWFYTPVRLLARADVILVVAHYRLGLLGFFSTGDAVVPGNNGLKDQAFSIRWVHENIAAFGGDPTKVTIFGESAGGASVAYQYISPLNKGLIQGAISQSGTALSFWPIDRNPAASAKLMATRLGCADLSHNSSAMVACLREVPWQNIIKAQRDYIIESVKNMTFHSATMTPVVEPKNTPGAFITEEPEVILKSGDIPDIPWMLGANKHDGSFVLATLHLIKFGPEGLDKNKGYLKERVVPDILQFAGVRDPEPGNRVVASAVELAFLEGVDRSSWNDSMPGLIDVLSVLTYKSSIQNTAEILATRNRTVYLYSFEHSSNNTLWSLYFGPDAEKIPVEHGIVHGDELQYLFNFPVQFTPEDESFSEVISDLWLNFARFGNPTPLADSRYEQWTRYNSLEEPYLQLNGSPTVHFGYRNSWRAKGFQ